MRFCTSFILAAVFELTFSATTLDAEQHLGISRQYLETYLEIKDADELEKNHEYLGSLARFKWAGIFLEHMRQTYPYWETDLLAKRIKECNDEVVNLRPQAATQILTSFRALSSGPPVSQLFDEGVRLEQGGDYRHALISFDEYEMSLEVIHQRYPNWESDEIEKKMQEAQAKIEHLRSVTLK